MTRAVRMYVLRAGGRTSGRGPARPVSQQPSSAHAVSAVTGMMKITCAGTVKLARRAKSGSSALSPHETDHATIPKAA